MIESVQTDAWQALILLLWPILQKHLNDWKKFPWLTDAMRGRNHLISLLVAVLTTLGLHYSWMGNAQAGWTFTFSIPPLVAMQHVAGQWIGQYVLGQHLKNTSLLEQIVAQGIQK